MFICNIVWYLVLCLLILDHTVESEQSDKIDERDYLEQSVKGTAERVRKVLKRTIPQEISFQSSKIKKIWNKNGM